MTQLKCNMTLILREAKYFKENGANLPRKKLTHT
jgi:hypothetical protein